MKPRGVFSGATANLAVPNVFDVSPHDVEKNKGDIYIIDVRGEDEFNGELGHIDAARLIPLEDLDDNAADLPKDKPIVFVCRSGNRSAYACAIALDAGLSEVYNMQGGMILWNRLGLERV